MSYAVLLCCALCLLCPALLPALSLCLPCALCNLGDPKSWTVTISLSTDLDFLLPWAETSAMTTYSTCSACGGCAVAPASYCADCVVSGQSAYDIADRMGDRVAMAHAVRVSCGY